MELLVFFEASVQPPHLPCDLSAQDHCGHVHFHETLWRLASAATGTDMRDVQESEATMACGQTSAPENERRRFGLLDVFSFVSPIESDYHLILVQSACP